MENYNEAVNTINLQNLIAMKEILKNDELSYIETKNKQNGWIGCATFYTNGEQKIKVFEGDGSGKDDKAYTYEEFIKKYEFKLERER